MATYEPPTENLAIFDPSVFGKTSFITTGAADNRYLQFPVAQGAETLQETTVNGALTVTNTASFTSLNPPTSLQTIPVSNDNSTKIPTTSWVQTAITAAIPTSLLGLNNSWTGINDFLNTGTGSLTSAAIQPVFNDNSTKIPTTSWVQTAITGAIPTSLLGLNNSWTGNNDFLNTGTGSLTSLAIQPVPADNSTKIPTTSWVQSLVATLPLPSSLLGLNNSWTGVNDFLNTGTGSLTSAATQPVASDNSNKIPTTAWVQSAISAVGSILGLNNTWTGTQNWTNTGVGSLTSSAVQPAVTDNSTKIPTTAWVQSVLGQFLNPITTSVSTAQQIFPPTPLHLYGQGYIIGRGGLAGEPATPDFGPWDMGGAGGGAGGVSFNFHLQNNTLYMYFGLNYTSSGYSSLSFNSVTPSVGNTLAIAPVGGNGQDANMGAAGGSGGVGIFTTISGTGLISVGGTPNNGTAGTAGTGGQTGSTLVFPTGGSNAYNVNYGFGQSHPALDGYNTSGYINYQASPIGDPRCVITWYVSPPP
jgi:hypothetical protein